MAQSVLLIGRTDECEFRLLHDWLRRNLQVTVARDLPSAPSNLDDFDIILIAMSLRFQFSLDEIQQLRTRAPLTRICAIVGSWCEGETRSGQAWPGVERMYVQQVIPRAITENWRERIPYSPSTLSNDERWLERATRNCADPSDHSCVLICSRHHESGAALALACRHIGYHPFVVRPDAFGPNPDVQAVIYDADRNRELRLRQIRDLARCFPAARLVTLLEFPRHDEITQITAAGGHQVLGKPFDIDDLTACLAADPVNSSSVQDSLESGRSRFPS